MASVLGCLPFPHLPDKGVYGAFCGLMHVTAAHVARSAGGHKAPGMAQCAFGGHRLPKVLLRYFWQK